MATHFSVLAWKIPWTEERGRLQSIGLQRVEGFPGSSTGKKNLPAMQEMRIQSLGQEDLLQKDMATRSCILAWEIS